LRPSVRKTACSLVRALALSGHIDRGTSVRSSNMQAEPATGKVGNSLIFTEGGR